MVLFSLCSNFKVSDLKQTWVIMKKTSLWVSYLNCGWRPLNAGEFTYMGLPFFVIEFMDLFVPSVPSIKTK